MDDFTGLKRSLMMIACSLVSLPAGATTFNSWDADSPTVPGAGVCNMVNAVIDTNEKHEGTGSMRLDVPDGSEPGHTGCKGDAFNPERYSPTFKWTSGKSVYYRVWMKFSPSFNWGNRQYGFKATRLNRDGSAEMIMTPKFRRDQVDVSECHASQGCSNATCSGEDSCFKVDYDFDPATNPAITSWHEYIWHLKLQTGASGTDAYTELYIDGELWGTSLTGSIVNSAHDGDFSGASWGKFWLQAPYPQMCTSGSCGAGGQIWLDDYSVDDTWNSTFASPGGPPLPDAHTVEPFCPAGSNPDAAVIFCDNFENVASLSSDYFEYNDDSGDFVPVAGEGVSGGSAMRGQWEAGESEAGNLKVAIGRNPVGSNIANDQDFREIYWRLFMRTGPGWSGEPYKLSRATALVDSNWRQSFIAHVWTDGADTLAIDPASGTSVDGQLVTTQYNDFANLRWLGLAQGATPVFASSRADQWQCIEAHVMLNNPSASDGKFELWIDDVLDAQITGLNWVGDYADYGINSVFVENFWNGGAPGSRVRYLDNLVISTSRIGCGGGGSVVRPEAPVLLPNIVE